MLLLQNLDMRLLAMRSASLSLAVQAAVLQCPCDIIALYIAVHVTAACHSCSAGVCV